MGYLQQSEEKDSEEGVLRQLPSETQLFAWSCLHFVNPLMRIPADKDPESLAYHRRQFKYLRNSRVRARARYDQHRAGRET